MSRTGCVVSVAKKNKATFILSIQGKENIPSYFNTHGRPFNFCMSFYILTLEE